MGDKRPLAACMQRASRPFLLPADGEGGPMARMTGNLLSTNPSHSPRRPRPTERASMAVICPSLR